MTETTYEENLVKENKQLTEQLQDCRTELIANLEILVSHTARLRKVRLLHENLSNYNVIQVKAQLKEILE